MPTKQLCGRRETNKQRTREALNAAAVSILIEEGIEAVTADRIAEVAGVSRRTLFNYFNRVEDVLVAQVEDVTRETIEAFLERPVDESLRDSAHAVLGTVLESPVFAQTFALEKAATTSPATRRFLRELTDNQIDALAEGIRSRLGPGADPVYVIALAAAVGAVLARVTQFIHQQSPDADPQDPRVLARLHSAVRDGIDLIFTGFPESRSTSKEN